ncbi:MAG: TrbI/VirB10 family protein [Xanthomonadales bacterium]|nr:TrbI/VirB10 family protein [Xanthomonadales bacterium]
MSGPLRQPAGDESVDHDPATATGHPDALVDNTYTRSHGSAAAPELDDAVPRLKARELRRLNQRALVLLVAVCMLLLLVAYWLLSGAGHRPAQAQPREEKVTVADAPGQLALPRVPQTLPAHAARAIPLMATPPLPPLPAHHDQAGLRGAVAAPAPTAAQRRIAVRSDTSPAMPASGMPVADLAGPPPLPADLPSRATSALDLAHPDVLMQRGTYIRCVLETRIVSDIPGFASCLVTERVYSLNGQHLLLPKGSKILGSYARNPVGQRVAVVWDRIITPTGIDVNMASPGIDNLGGAGLPGEYDAHWRSRIGSALLISMLSDAFKYEAAEHGPRSTTISNGVVTQQPFQSNTAQTVQNLANQAVREAANRPPTVTINQGTVVYVYVARDVDFSAVARL